jgi:hypothetical protein
LKTLQEKRLQGSVMGSSSFRIDSPLIARAVVTF